jgi:hypothetical protein
MIVEEARKKGVCRICSNPMWKDTVNMVPVEDLIFNYGAEYAHKRCLESERSTNLVEQTNADDKENYPTTDPDLQV